MQTTDRTSSDGSYVVYTAVLGGYDQLYRPLSTDASIRFVCFTDTPEAVPSPWTAIAVAPVDDVDQRIRRARFIKTHPHRLLGGHEISVWIDANLELVADARELVSAMREHDIATFAYPSTYGLRDCAYQEARACIARGKDFVPVIEEQVARYRGFGYPEHNGLAETSIVVRRNTPATARSNELWWREIAGGSRRDQVSFNYALWRCGMRYDIIPGSRRESPFTRFHPHRKAIYPV
jgi:hypothetical protein